MGSSNKTSLGLNLWQGNDYRKFEDDNNDNQIIDNEIVALKTSKSDTSHNHDMDYAAMNDVGNIATLQTTEKSNVVGAINEVKQTADGKAPSNHNHDGTYEAVFSKKSGFNLDKSDAVDQDSSETLATSKAVKIVNDKAIAADVAATVWTVTINGSVIEINTGGIFPFLQGKVIKFKLNAGQTGITGIKIDLNTTLQVKELDGTVKTDFTAGYHATVLQNDGTDFFEIAPSGSGGGAIKSIQRGSLTFSSVDMYRDITINPVDFNKSVAIVTCRPGNHMTAPKGMVNPQLLSGTLLRILKGDNGETLDVSWTVIEFDNVKSLQRGNADVTPTNNNITINPVDLDKVLLFSTIYASSSVQTSYSYFIGEETKWLPFKLCSSI